MIRTFVAIIFIIVLLAGSAAGELNNERSSRGSVLGYGFTALADEPAGIYFNPAGIAFLDDYQITSMFSRISRYNLPSDDESPLSGLIGGYISKKDFGALAFHSYRRGSFTENTQMTTTNDLTFTYSKLLSPQLSAGINLKYTFETNYAKNKGPDFDIGAVYKLNDNVNLGFTAENVFRKKLTSTIYGDGRHRDRMFRMAISYVTDDLIEPTVFVFALGAKQQHVTDTVATYRIGSFGFEQWFRNDMPFSIALRAGYTITKELERELEQISFGFSLRFHNRHKFLRIDYGYHKYPFDDKEVNLATGTHMVTVVYGIGGLLRIPVYD